jgi:uracil-DNA glycosylase
MPCPYLGIMGMRAFWLQMPFSIGLETVWRGGGEKMDSLEEIAQLVHRCTDCVLHESRTIAVPGDGDANADIMFIGEGPGYQEDRQGKPFVGPAGRFLDELLASIGLKREQVFITNMVKCRPPQNRDPQPSEMLACSKYLNRQIELINPKLIVTLGRFSLGKFFPGESISRARGKAREKEGRFIYPIMHPAAGLHRHELRAAIEEDFRAIPGVLEKARQSSAPAAEPDQEDTPPPGQLTLF